MKTTMGKLRNQTSMDYVKRWSRSRGLVQVVDAGGYGVYMGLYPLVN